MKKKQKKNISLYSETTPRNVLKKVYKEVRWLSTWNIFVRFEELRTSQRVSVHNTHTRAHNIQDSLIQEFTLKKKGTVTALGALGSIFVVWAPMDQAVCITSTSTLSPGINSEIVTLLSSWWNKENYTV